MKILRLRFSNLNSLRGESPVLDFTVPPLAGSGLFAITGPTGAGKTTILDAITLALYGCAARYGSTKPEQMMSRHTGECYAEVEFACTSGNYRSTWQLRRARSKPEGELQPPARRLIKLPEEIVIAERLRDVDEQIASLTGLDYARFLRSVMLAQGEFAAFLKAGANERTELLEQVTGTSIYRGISQAAYDRAKTADQALKDLKLEQGAVKLLTEDERQTRLDEIAEISAKVQTLKTSLEALENRLHHARAAQRIARETQLLETETQTLTEAKQAFAPAAEKLAAHRRAQPHQLALASWQRSQQQLQQQEAALKELELKLPSLKEAAALGLSKLTSANEALQITEAQEKSVRPLFLEITELDAALVAASVALTNLTASHQASADALTKLDGEIKSSQDELEKLAGEEKILAAWQDQNVADETLPQRINSLSAGLGLWSEKESQRLVLGRDYKIQNDALTKFKKDLAALAVAFEKLNADHKVNVDKATNAQSALDVLLEKQLPAGWETQKNSADQRWHQLQALTGLQQQRTVLEKSCLDHQTLVAKNSVQLDGLKAQLVTVSSQVEQASALLEARRKSLSLAERVQSLESDRANLQVGSPCPLCGSVEHPFADHATAPALEVAQCQQAVKDAEHALTELNSRWQSLRETIASSSTSLASSTSAQQALQQQLQDLLGQWSKISDSPGPDQAHQLPELFAHQTERRDHLAKRLQDIRSAETTFHAARQKSETSLTIVNEQKLALTSLESKIAAGESQLAEILAKGKLAREQCDAAAVSVQKLLEPVNETGLTLTVATEALARLGERAANWQATLAKRQQITTTKAGVQATLTEKSAQRLQLFPVLQAAAQAMEAATKTRDQLQKKRQEKFGTQTVAEAERALNAQLASARSARDEAVKNEQTAASQLTTATERFAHEKVMWQTAQAMYSTAEADLIRAAGADGFDSISVLQAALLDAPAATALETEERTLHDRHISLSTKQTTLQQERDALPFGASDDASQLEGLETNLADLRADQAVCQVRLGNLTEQVRHDDGERTRHSALGSHIDAATRDRDRWGRLNTLIGSANGVSFSKFAQGLTLERLTNLANTHLLVLNPRYTMRRDERRPGDLEIEIVDHYQADVARSMQSLSGGESFLVSLALALGLSELAGGRSPIDSLFIDEGFGTLDAESLETAMDALENLRATGKTIGVISHVEAMKERIPTQIRVVKTENGSGRLEVVS